MKSLKVWQLVVGLVLVVGGSVLFILAIAGVFNAPRAEIDAEYICGESCDGEYMEIDIDEYESLVADGKSFVVMIDQGGCTTADRLREFVQDFAVSKGFRVYKMMFGDMKRSSLYEFVKYYPSVAVISKGKVIGYLRADADEDSGAYNDYGAFSGWLQKYLR